MGLHLHQRIIKLDLALLGTNTTPAPEGSGPYCSAFGFQLRHACLAYFALLKDIAIIRRLCEKADPLFRIRFEKRHYHLRA